MNYPTASAIKIDFCTAKLTDHITPSSFVLVAWLTTYVSITIIGIAPDTVLSASPLFCPFHAITTIECPGCGMTRAFIALAGGDVVTAFHFNPFSPSLFTAVVLPTFKINPVKSRRLSTIFYATSLTVLLAWWFSSRLLPAVSTLPVF